MMSQHFWPMTYLTLSAVSFWWYVRLGERLEDTHFALSGAVLGFLGIMEMVRGEWVRDRLDEP